VTDRYTCPPFDPTGKNGPRHIGECTPATQHRYENGPRFEGLPGYLVATGGHWFVDGQGQWRRDDEGEGGDR